MINKQELEQQVSTVVHDLLKVAELNANKILVIGASTSEVLGERIGTSGSVDVAEIIFSVLKQAQSGTGFMLAFQCCEHLNRALVVERETAERFGLTEVSAVPVAKAGGSMAAFAYTMMSDPVLVEEIAAHAGIDIGDTFIGMHLRRVAVPVRPTTRMIGNAHVTMAITRPKLIGGIRAVYERPLK